MSELPEVVRKELEHGEYGPDAWRIAELAFDLGKREGAVAGVRAVKTMIPTAEMIQAAEDRQIEGASYIAENSIQFALWREVLKAALAQLPEPPLVERAMGGKKSD